MVKQWFTEFHWIRINTGNAERSGSPSEVDTPQTIVENSRYGVGLSEIESARDPESHIYIDR